VTSTAPVAVTAARKASASGQMSLFMIVRPVRAGDDRPVARAPRIAATVLGYCLLAIAAILAAE
jgi:hypothetical protein